MRFANICITFFIFVREVLIFMWESYVIIITHIKQEFWCTFGAEANISCLSKINKWCNLDLNTWSIKYLIQCDQHLTLYRTNYKVLISLKDIILFGITDRKQVLFHSRPAGGGNASLMCVKQHRNILLGHVVLCYNSLTVLSHFEVLCLAPNSGYSLNTDELRYIQYHIYLSGI